MTSQKDILDYFEERFGISKSLFKSFRIYADQKGRIFLCSKRLSAQSSAVSIGMHIARVGNDIKPSTNFLQLFGRHATKNHVSLTKEQAQAYVKGEDIELSAQDVSSKSAEPASVQVSDGYILLKYLDYPLACGMLKGKQVKNVLPKARRSNVEFL
ncbi:MAG TPA: hypothetical protein VJ485_03530 [archaeon]|nr:hypothetical protein [archaeon]